MKLCRCWVLLVVLAACRPPTTHVESGASGPPPRPVASESLGRLPPGGVEGARLSYVVLRANGQEVSKDEFFATVSKARAVCVGEMHDNAHYHWAQLEVLDHITSGDHKAPMALGLEMLPYGVQGVLDDYARGTIDEEALLARSGWKDRWRVDWGFYQPILLMAKARGLGILALNAPSEITQTVSRKGVDALSESERAQLPELDLKNDSHHAFFLRTMEETKHPMPEGGMERMYASMVIWDETMAHNAAQWLKTDKRRKVMIIAGLGHCRNDGVAGRLRRRGIEDVVSVRPVIVEGPGTIADLLVRPEADFLWVMTPAEKDAPTPAAPKAADAP